MDDVQATEGNESLDKKVSTFLDVSCGCSFGNGEDSCLKSFSKETMLFNLHNCLELSKEELDLVILANIQASTHGHDKQVDEKRSRSPRGYFAFKSIPICKKMFLQLYGISDHRFRSLKEHYDHFGIYPRTHGNMKRMPSNTLPHSTTVDIKAFILKYIEENGVLLPGRIPGYKNDEIKLLSSCESKMGVWKCYSKSCEAVRKTSLC